MSSSPAKPLSSRSNNSKDINPEALNLNETEISVNNQNDQEIAETQLPATDIKEELTENESKALEINSTTSLFSPKVDETNIHLSSIVKESPGGLGEENGDPNEKEASNPRDSPLASPKVLQTLERSASASAKPSPTLSPRSVESTADASMIVHDSILQSNETRVVVDSKKPIFEPTEIPNALSDILDKKKAKTKNKIKVSKIENNDNSNYPDPCKTDVASGTVKSGDPEDKTMTEEHKNKLRESFLNLVENHVLPPSDLSVEIQLLLHAAEFEALEKEDYDYGEKIEDARKLLCTYLEETSNSNKSTEYTDLLKQRLELAKNDYMKKNQYWDEVLTTFRTEQSMLRQKLKEKHDNELADFEKKWSDMTNRNFFNKPSATLLNMRKQQKILAMAKAWSDAKEVKARADNLQKIETQRAMARAVSCMKQEHQNLIDKQRKELECFNEHERKTSIFLHSERFSAMHPIEMSIKNLTNSLEKPQVSVRSTKNTFQPSIRARMRSESVMGQRQPGTSRKFSQFRFRDTTSKLDLSGIDVKKFLGKSASIKVCRVLND